MALVVFIGRVDDRCWYGVLLLAVCLVILESAVDGTGIDNCVWSYSGV